MTAEAHGHKWIWIGMSRIRCIICKREESGHARDVSGSNHCVACDRDH